MKKILNLLLLTLVSSGITAQADQLVNIQFGGNSFGDGIASVQTGAGLTGTTGDQWNNLTNTWALLPLTESNSGGGVDLNDSTGSGSGVHLTITNSSLYGGNLYEWSNGPASTNPLTGSVVSNLSQGEIGTDDPSVQFAFSGLSDNQVFNIYVYSTPDNWSRSAAFSLNGSTPVACAALNTVYGYPNGGYNDYLGGFSPVAGLDYVLLSGTADGSGNFILTGTSLNGDINVNGFQLQIVPEPATCVMLLGGLGMLLAGQRIRSNRKS